MTPTFLRRFALLLASVTLLSVPAFAAEYLAEAVAALQVKWPKNHTLNIVCHGHSVPSGYFKTPTVQPFDAYPHLWHVGLQERFPHAVINVIVTAIGGENSVAGAARFERDVLSLRPEIVTIDYALNDRRIGLEKAKAAWQSMITQAQQQGVKVLLLTPTGDTAAKLDDPADPLNQHAAQIRQLAQENGVGLVDSLAAYQEYLAGGGKLEELQSQANHPNRKGHELVVQRLLRWCELPPKEAAEPK